MLCLSLAALLSGCLRCDPMRCDGDGETEIEIEMAMEIEIELDGRRESGKGEVGEKGPRMNYNALPDSGRARKGRKEETSKGGEEG